MPYVPRLLNLKPLLEKSSVFLFGPRQTGKSTYVREQLKGVFQAHYDLLESDTFRRLASDPSRLRQELLAADARNAVVVIDEIQKCPGLLDEVQWLMEERGLRFLLTGSSARKLRRTGTNLLGGRGRDRALHPFIYPELRDNGLTLEKAMHRGLIPRHFFSDDPDDDLASYVGRYLAEEIAAEGVTRNVPAFSRFLEVAATCNTQRLNYTAIASDAQVPRQTVQVYFQVLKDTLLGYELAPFVLTIKRKAIATPKFYFFDMGVVRALRQLGSVNERSADFGPFFEHFIFLELRAWIDYRRPRAQLAYWRSRSGFEVDFVLDRRIGIEVKAARSVAARDARGLAALAEEGGIERRILVCREPKKRLLDGVWIYPWEDFLDELWSDRLV